MKLRGINKTYPNKGVYKILSEVKQSLLGAPAAEAKRLPVTLLLEWKTEFKHYFREEATVSEEPGARAETGNENRKHSKQFVQKETTKFKVSSHTEDSTRNRAEKQILPNSSHEDLERNCTFALGGLKSAAFYNYTRVIKQGIPGSGVCTLPDRKAAITGMAGKAASPDYISHNPRCLLPVMHGSDRWLRNRHPGGKSASCVA